MHTCIAHITVARRPQRVQREGVSYLKQPDEIDPLHCIAITGSGLPAFHPPSTATREATVVVCVRMGFETIL